MGAEKPDVYPGMKIVQLFDSVLWTFPGEKKLKDEQSRQFWNPMFNHAIKLRDWRERYMGIGRYVSSKALLMDHMKVVEDGKQAGTGAALNVFLGWIAAALQIKYSDTVLGR